MVFWEFIDFFMCCIVYVCIYVYIYILCNVYYFILFCFYYLYMCILLVYKDLGNIFILI